MKEKKITARSVRAKSIEHMLLLREFAFGQKVTSVKSGDRNLGYLKYLLSKYYYKIVIGHHCGETHQTKILEPWSVNIMAF